MRAARRVDRHRVAAAACERGERHRAELEQALRRRVRARVAAAELTYVEDEVAKASASWLLLSMAESTLGCPKLREPSAF